MKVLVTGGLGYIGSHVVVDLCARGYEVVIIDNLSNTTLNVLDSIVKITGVSPVHYNIDVRDKNAMHTFFIENPDLHSVIHFAAFKAVGESVANPLDYYENNINSLVYLLQHLKDMPQAHLIFSSSCTVYGQAATLPVTEDAPVQPATSPYGNTKQIGEEIIKDVCAVTPSLHSIALRYFNPIGAHDSALIGELPLGIPQNLVPFITQTAIGIRKQLSVYGDDYPTPDGTAIRDYIHVVDLAAAHVTALERLINNASDTTFEAFNIGTGTGSSVLEVIQSFEAVTGLLLNYKIVARRDGDITAAFANTHKATTVLGWTAQHSLKDALGSAWKWEQAVRNT